ncbi:MAG: succinyl-diaminopimelate desuccinylase [Paracoccaceae bacterium]|jgi:succinyl-diaminopimelate desuccinylase|nr:succinyl-diaminopimelate desuccinylase [Paracoccaceae bacterium]
MPSVDPVSLTADLIRCPSITPEEGGALVVLQDLLEGAGFACTRVDRGDVSNLFARWGDKGHAKTFGFNGHTDVVPLGDRAAWTMPPFGAEVKDGFMYGRGAVDMKSGVAAFAAAAVDFVRKTPVDGAIVMTVTGDEEGVATDGTIAILDWMETEGERMSACIVGEPTCPDQMGDMIKIGRRGSMTAWITVTGVQGHSAYPHRAVNPVSAIARLMDRLASFELDRGTDHFDASTVAVVNIDTGNTATNVIPAESSGIVNIRFNDQHTGAGISQWLWAEAARIEGEFGVKVLMDIKISGESFLTPPGDLSTMVANAVKAETGRMPEFSTSGGTSDARFIKNHCPVVEVGLVGKSMHQVDERVDVAQIPQLKAIYTRILRDYFA